MASNTEFVWRVGSGDYKASDIYVARDGDRWDIAAIDSEIPLTRAVFLTYAVFTPGVHPIGPGGANFRYLTGNLHRVATSGQLTISSVSPEGELTGSFHFNFSEAVAGDEVSGRFVLDGSGIQSSLEDIRVLEEPRKLSEGK